MQVKTERQKKSLEDSKADWKTQQKRKEPNLKWMTKRLED